MTIVELQRHVGAEPDGIWGVKSAAACQAYLRSLMPVDNPWPKSDPDSLTRFFGTPGNEAYLVNLDVDGLGVKYEGKLVKTIRCNQRVAESLGRVLREISAGPHAAILSEYAGCFNFRRKRGGSSYSLHAYGAAIDLHPDENGMRDSWPLRSTMPLAVIKSFAREGWKSAAVQWGYDSMHFECTR